MTQSKSIMLILVLCLFSARAGDVFSKFYPLADEIIKNMTLDQKIGQSLQTDFDQFNKGHDQTDYAQIKQYNLGSVLIGGNGCPDGLGNIRGGGCYHNATLENWNLTAQEALQYTTDVLTGQEGYVRIKLLLGTDAVHGNQHALGAVLFPHNIGLAATHNSENFKNAAHWNQKSVRASGFNFAFAPTVAISHNPQWGRFYETMGDNSTAVYDYAYEYVSALQVVEDGYLKGILASTKHFLGDGATLNGNDEGNTRVNNMTKFLEVNLAGYYGALAANCGNIMVSYSAINEIPMSINTVLLQGLLKEQMGFDGFLISDYDAVGKVAGQGKPTTCLSMSKKQAYMMTLNAGMDMIMQRPDNNEVTDYFRYMNELISEGAVAQSRLDEAVRRILAVKLAMQLVEVPEAMASRFGYKNKNTTDEVTYTDEERHLEYLQALQAAQESLVLLKNDQDTLPLSQHIKYVVLIGEKEKNYEGTKTLFQGYDNIGMQNGGWGVRWQGYEGNEFWSGEDKKSSNASSILDSLQQRFGNSVTILEPAYDSFTDFNKIETKRLQFLYRLRSIKDMNKTNTVIIGAIGESPYAEFMGDINSTFCKNATFYVEGCLYNYHINEYLPDQQPYDLSLNYDEFALEVLDVLRSTKAPLVTVLFSGRPMIVDQSIDISNAFVAAWLPGTAGGAAVVNALFGDYTFRYKYGVNTLPVSWIHEGDSLWNFPIYDSDEQPIRNSSQFYSGYGLGIQNISE